MSDEAKPVKKPGRPAKNPGQGQRPTVTFRCPRPLHERLQAEASKADRSVSEEVERRVAEAYHTEDNRESIVKEIGRLASDVIFDLIYKDVGGVDNYQAGLHFAHALKSYQTEADRKFRSEETWFRDPDKKKYVGDKTTSILPAIIESLILRLDPEARQRWQDNLHNSPLMRLGAGLSPLGSLGGSFDPQGDQDSQQVKDRLPDK